jgi:tetratricopeptide (TPR) repeat protein
MAWRTAILAIVVATPALAECPPPADVAEDQSRLSAQLRHAPGPGEAREIQNELWQLWTAAPDEAAQELLDRGMAMREGYDLAGSRAELDELVEYCPDYPEGYNQRAFSAFLAQDYGAALDDLETVLDMNPEHVPARAGLALTLMGLGRTDAAQGVLRDAVRRNPWLSERALLTDPPGKDI